LKNFKFKYVSLRFDCVFILSLLNCRKSKQLCFLKPAIEMRRFISFVKILFKITDDEYADSGIILEAFKKRAIIIFSGDTK